MTTPSPRSSTRAALRNAAVILLALATLVLTSAGPAAAQSFTDPTIERQILVDGLADPTALEVTPDGRVIWVHREGRVKIWKQDGTVVDAAKVPVDAYDRAGNGQWGGTETCPRGDECPAGFELAEGGIHGILLAEDFAETGHLYLYYTVVGSLGSPVDPPKMPDARGPDDTESKFRLSRFTLVGDTLDLESEVALFENPAEWFHCCHYGGDMEWLSDGSLVLTVGDDTISDFSGGFSPHDPRPGWEFNNADLTAQNLADRRGKVLRIDVNGVLPDAPGQDPRVPPDNPFLEVDGADPYVYAYGFRSNYRVSVDPGTDTLYVATVGPDSRNANANRGPAAHEEIETVPPGGGTNHGWPRCIANNEAYNRYDFETNTSLEKFDCTGMTPASFYYTANPSPTTSPYLTMGTGGLTAMAGVVYERPDSGALRLPAPYDGQLLWMEFARNQVWRTPINADGTLNNNPALLLPAIYGGPRNPIDSQVGPDGAVYLVEYGTGIWNNTNGRISRLICDGCTPDPADYGGARVVDPDVALSLGGVDTGGLVDAGLVGRMVLLGLAVAATLGRTLRRRRRVI